MNRLISSPLMVFVYIFFAIAGVFVGLTIGGDRFGFVLAILLPFGFVLALAVVEIVFRQKTAVDIEPVQDFSSIQEALIAGGKMFGNVAELPDEVKKVYQQLLQDASSDGILDVLQGAAAKGAIAEAIKIDQVEQLNEAKQMLDGGLITRDDYQATVKQIIVAK